jgi:hypothetical protein
MDNIKDEMVWRESVSAGHEADRKSMIKAQSSIKDIPKDAYNEYHDYMYTSAEQMLSTSRDALHKVGISVHLSNCNLEWDNGVWIAKLVFERIHNGTAHIDQFDYPVVEGKGRPIDKAYAGAVTTGMSYYLRGLLLLPRVDAEVDTRDDSDYEPTKPKGVYKKETMDFASVLALHPSWAGSHSVEEVLLLGEERTNKIGCDKSMTNFILNSIDKLEKEGDE